MKRTFVTTLFILLSILSAYSQNGLTDVISNIKWGASIPELKAKYGELLVDTTRISDPKNRSFSQWVSVLAVKMMEPSMFDVRYFVDSMNLRLNCVEFIAHNMKVGSMESLVGTLNSIYGKYDDSQNGYRWYVDNLYIETSLKDVDKVKRLSVLVRPLNPAAKHFRSSRWGDTKASVIKAEKKFEKAAFSSDDGYSFYDYFAGIGSNVFFMFDNDALLQGKYIMMIEKHKDENDFIKEYNKLCTHLTSLYGKSESSKIAWKDETFKDVPANYGHAISIGHLEYRSLWETPESDIYITLSGENYRIELSVTYVSKKYKNHSLRK